MKKILFIIFSIFSLINLIAQNYQTMCFNANNGLEQDCINNMMEDEYGFIWMYNNSNLIRFDGVNFKNFYLPNNKKIVGIFNGTEKFSKTILVMDINHDIYKINKNKFNFLYNTDKNDSLYFFYGKFFDLKKIFKKDLLRPYYYQYLYINEKNMYFDNFFCDKLQTVKIFKDYNPVNFRLFNVGDTAIYFNKITQQAWLCYKGCVINNIKKNNIEKTALTSFNSNDNNGIFDFRSKACIYAHNGFYKFKIEDNKITLKLFIKSEINNRISSFLTHSVSGDYYASTYKGLYQIQKKKFNLFNIENKSTCSVSFILKIGKDSFCTNLGLLIKNANKTLFDNNYKFPDYVVSMFKYKGNCYFMYGDGLYLFELKNKKVKLLFELPIKTYESVFLTKDALGQVLISYDSKIFKIDIENQKHKQLFDLNKIDVNNFKFDKNKLFVASKNGFIILDTLTKNKKHLLNGIEVRNYYIDNNLIWLGTYGNGYFIYNTKTDKLCKMPLDENKSLSHSHCFAPDTLGNIFVSTNNGIISLNKRKAYNYLNDSLINIGYRNFNTNEGLPISEFNSLGSPNYDYLSNGNIVFASINGVLEFNPYSFEMTPNLSPILIDGVVVNNKEYLNDNYSFPPNTVNIKFQLATPLFGSNSNFCYEYKILGIDNEWQKLNNKGDLLLNYLKHGKYLLLIRKPIIVGSDSYIYKQIEFSIALLFYETQWFLFLVILSCFCVLYILFNLRNKINQNQKRTLEREVYETTLTINRSLTELEAKKEDLQKVNDLKERLIGVLAHDIRSPLKSTHTVANYLLKQLLGVKKNNNKLNFSELEEMMLIITESVKSLYDYSSDFLVWYNLQKDLSQINLQEINLKDIVGSLLNVYKPVIDLKGNHIINTINENIILNTEPNLLLIIIRNLVDNANKYTELNAIYLQVIRDENEMRISISNQGNEMTEDEIDCINQKITSKNTNINPQEGQKMGLNLVAFFCNVLKYKLDFKTKNGLHEFIVTIPIR